MELGDDRLWTSEGSGLSNASGVTWDDYHIKDERRSIAKGKR